MPRVRESRATRITRLARELGLHTARAVYEERHGWICTVTIPGREQIYLHDVYDIYWLLTEMRDAGATEREVVAA